MKRAKQIVFVFVGVSCILWSSYLIWRDICNDPYIPRGYIDCEEHREEIPWMDWTDFCWYQYPSADKIDLPEGYQQVKEEDIIFIKGYFDNTRNWLEVGNRLDEYSFDSSCITEGDFWLLPAIEENYNEYAYYQLYFYDTESSRLYYLNNNA